MRAFIVFTALTMAASFAACGGSITGTGGATSSSSSSGHTGGSTTTVSSSSSSVASSSSGGGAGGSGATNTSFATAQAINVGSTLMEDLPDGESQYFSFTGTKGEALDIEAICQYFDSANPAPFDPTYLDTVVSLYDASHHKIAENNDIPGNNNDADLFTVLPADGTYFVRVTECWTWSTESGKKCAAPQKKTHTQYTLQIYKKDPSQNNVVFDPTPDPGDTSASATPLKWAKTSGSQYYNRTDVVGFFQTATDVDWFSFTPPSGVPLPQGRLTMYITPVPGGTSQDGSTEGIGAVTVFDATGTQTLAQVNGSTGQLLELPVTASTPYLLSVQRNDGITGSNDFYVTWVRPSNSNPVEASDATNGTLAGAEKLVPYTSGSGVVGAYANGDLTPAGVDVDHYAAAVPAGLPGTATVYAWCGGQWYGSGLRGLSVTLRDAMGNMLAAATETANQPAFTSHIAVPAGAQDLYIQVSASSQDPVVSGTYYTCGISFVP